MKDSDYGLRCPECHAQFPFPKNTEDIKWAYRTLGAFSSSNQADGAYTVLLTLRFFSVLLRGATTPLMSFEIQKDGTEPLEADLGLFYQTSKFSESETKIILAECKTFNAFEQKDIDRMTDLRDAFPGAILVFAKLTDSLTDEEKDLLLPFIEESWKHYDGDQPYNPIMILTGKELFLESLWKSHLDKVQYKDLIDICYLTQDTHLGRGFRIKQRISSDQQVNPTPWSPIVKPHDNQNE